jgi:hypothetical protein
VDLALQALAVFALVLPGILLQLSYRSSSFVQRYESRNPRPLSEEIAYSIPLAVLVHAIFASITCWFYPINLDALGHILSGNYGQDDVHLEKTLSAVTAHPYLVTGYFLGSCVIAIAGGRLFRGIVKKCEWDLTYPAFRLDSPWDYLFQGKGVPGLAAHVDVQGVIVTAATSFASENILYVGLLVDYQLTPSGDLDRVVITGAFRRDLAKDKDPGEQRTLPTFDKDAKYYPIDTTYLVLKYSEIRNLGVWYVVQSAS